MYIVTEYGAPDVAEKLTESARLSTLVVARRTWLQCSAFDALYRYRRVPSREVHVSKVSRFLAAILYNPVTEVTTHWEPQGECRLQDIVAEVERGLERDDDIIQQWFGADDVLKLLNSATTFDEMTDAVRCVRGEFECDLRLREIVDRVLG